MQKDIYILGSCDHCTSFINNTKYLNFLIYIKENLSFRVIKDFDKGR